PVNRGTKESRARAALYGEPMTDPWRELYEREYPRLVRALVAIGRDPAGAEDAAQEAFVKAHRTGLDHIAKPAAWLLVVGSREVFRRRRRSRRERELWAFVTRATRRGRHGGGPGRPPCRSRRAARSAAHRRRRALLLRSL